MKKGKSRTGASQKQRVKKLCDFSTAMSVKIPQMTQTVLFTTDIPQADISALEQYVDMLTTDCKKSMSYYCDVTDSPIPYSKILRSLKDVPIYEEQINQSV